VNSVDQGSADTLWDKKIDVLIKEYELAVNRYDTTDNRHIQLIAALVALLSIIGTYLTQALRIEQPSSAAATTGAGAVPVATTVTGIVPAAASAVVTNAAKIPTEIALMAPLLFIMLYAFFVYVMYTSRSHALICRVLTERLNALVKDKALIRFDPELPPSIFFQPIRAPATKIRLVYILLFAISFIYFFAVTAGAYFYIQTISHHWLATAFVLFYVSLGLLELFAFVGVVYDLPSWYERFAQDIKGYGAEPVPDKYSFREFYFSDPDSTELKAGINKGSVIACILPRRREFVTRGLVFWFGFVAAVTTVGFAGADVTHVQELFGLKRTQWVSGDQVPLWAWLALAFAYFFVEELLLQQSKYLWDYVRGDDCYKQQIAQRVTQLYMNNIPLKVARAVLALRLVLAFVLGYLIGGPVFFGLLLAIALHQAIYVLWVKPNTDRMFPIRLLFRSLSLPARFIAGALVWVEATWSYPLLLLLTLISYFYSLGGAAAHWKMDAVFRIKEGAGAMAKKEGAPDTTPLTSLPGPAQFLNCIGRDVQVEDQKSTEAQDEYFSRHGSAWRRLGLMIAIVFGGSLIVFEYLARFGALGLANRVTWYMRYDNTLQQRQYMILNSWSLWVWLLVIVVSTAIVLWAEGLFRRRMLEKSGNIGRVSPAQDGAPLRHIITSIAFLVGSALLLLSLAWDNTTANYIDNILILLTGFMLINIGRYIRYEGMTYEEYNNDKSPEQLRKALNQWYNYIFNPKPGQGIRDVVRETCALIW
jgi:hypothetical protein